MKFVLDHATKGKSYCATVPNGDASEQEVLVLKDDDAKEEWVKSLGANDEIWTLFGVSDNIALALHDRSVAVKRISGHYLPGSLKRMSRRADDRKKVLFELAKLAVEKPEFWYQYRPLDAKVAAVRANARCFYTVQEKIRKRAEQYYQAAYRERYLVDPLRHELTEGEFIKRELANKPVFAEIRKEEKYWLGEIKQSLRGIPIWEKVLKSTQFRGIGPALAGVIIGETGFMPRFKSRDSYVHYCGAHVVQGRSHLAEFGITSELAQRRAGQQANWQARLRQAIWKWSFIQIPKMAGQPKYAEDYWCQMYLRFKEEELQKRAARGIGEEGIVIPNPRKSQDEDNDDEENGENKRGQHWFTNMHCHKRACAKLRTKLVRRVHNEWVQLVKAGEM